MSQDTREATSQTIVIQPTKGIASLQLRNLWEYRQLIYFLIWRNIKVHYNQTALGVAWIVIQPTVSIIVFSTFFADPSEFGQHPILLSKSCCAENTLLAATKEIYHPRSMSGFIAHQTGFLPTHEY